MIQGEKRKCIRQGYDTGGLERDYFTGVGKDKIQVCKRCENNTSQALAWEHILIRCGIENYIVY